MPIIIEGGSRSAGWWWARHLQNTEKNERAELIEVVGLDSESVPELFREMHAMSLGSKAKNYFYQANINPRADEHLTPEQRHEAVETLGHNLGLDGQPYFVVEHEKEGRTHQHVIWLRVDLEHMKAIPDSLTARVHEQTSRELETKFGLEPGRSILVADRDFERPERRATKHERFRGAQNGLDPHAIGNELKALRERSDGGPSFRAGMDAAGYVLARGDRRDFVVIDQAGGDHNLARRLGMKAAELRGFMKEVDAASLPSVTEAKTRQHLRQAAHEAREKHGRAEPAPDPIRGQGIMPGRDNTGTGGPQTRQEVQPGARKEAKPERPLNPTQGAIRAAWTLSRTAEQLTEALAARGTGLACVTGDEARANQRARTFAKELGRFVRPVRDGEIVAVNERGHVYHLDPRTTGAERGEIEKRLAGVDAATLLSVIDTREAMRDVARNAAAEARRSAREQTRPVTRIEQAIIDADKAAAGDRRKFAEALDQAGLAIVRTTATDVTALDVLRRDQELARAIADAGDVTREPERHFGRLEQGELAAVTRRGDVFRLNPHHLENVVQRLAEAGTPSSITEARAAFEIEREAAASFRQEMIDIQSQRAEAAASSAREPERAAPTAAPAHDRGTRDAGDVGGRVGSSIVAALGAMLNFAASFIAPSPPPTKDQAERMEQAAEEQAPVRQAAQKDARHHELLDQIARDDLARRLEEQLRRDLSGRERDEDYSRGRERER